MKHLFLAALCVVMATAAVAAPKASTKNTPAKATPALKTLNYCPIAGEKLHSRDVGPTTYKGYKIAFCCGGCPEAFAELSDKEKDAKIAKIVAKQAKEGKANG
ncbi:hypothetical protein EON83_07030 [bacterium]|nr:MAG: hypothetical protein EON83_07030 [bacterium]